MSRKLLTRLCLDKESRFVHYLYRKVCEAERKCMMVARDRRNKKQNIQRSAHEANKHTMQLWKKMALTYVLIMLIPFAIFSTIINSYLTNEMADSVQSEMTNTLATAQKNFSQKINQMVAISLQIGQMKDFTSKNLSDYSYSSRKNIQQALLTFIVTGQTYYGISYYQRSLPNIVFTKMGTVEVTNYHIFYDAASEQWLTLEQMSDAQLNQRWYTVNQHQNVLNQNEKTLIFAQPLADISGGFLLFEFHEADIRSLLPSIADESQITIAQNGSLLYPFSASNEELNFSEAGLHKTQDGFWENTIYSQDFNITYVYRCKASDLGSNARFALQTFMVIMSIVGLVCIGIIVQTTRHHTKPIEQLVKLTEDLVPNDVYGLARLQTAMHQLRSYSQELVDIRTGALRTNVLIRLIRGRYSCEEDAEESLRRVDVTFRQPWRVIILLQQDQAAESDMPEKTAARLSSKHDVYAFSYAERSIFVMLVGMDSQVRQPLVEELKALSEEAKSSDRQIRFAVGSAFQKMSAASQSYMDALSAARRMTEECVTVYETEDEGAAFYPEEELNALQIALNNMDRNRVSFLYDILMRMVSRNRSAFLYTVTILSEMIRLYSEALPQENSSEARSDAALCDCQVNDIEDMLDCLSSLHTRMLQHMAKLDIEDSSTEMLGIANFISSCDELSTLTVSSVADRYGMNVSSLSHRFKNQMGCNISDYIFNCKMNHACALLRSTDQTVAEIAQQIGYSQYTSFVRQFKRQKGLTPTAYREAWRKEQE